MNSSLWIVAALTFVSLLLYAFIVRMRSRSASAGLTTGEMLPKTHLQRWAGWTLLEICFLTALSAGILLVHGPAAWWENDQVRLTVTFILLAALVTYLVFHIAVYRLKARDPSLFDERDKVILNRSGLASGGAMIGVMTFWMIALTESYRASQLVPTYFLTLIFWSLVMTNVIATLTDILVAYRRS